MRHACANAGAESNPTCCMHLLNFYAVFRDSLIKGTLATIYRQRGCFEDCEAVLDVELEVLNRYQRSSEGACAAQVLCALCN